MALSKRKKRHFNDNMIREFPFICLGQDDTMVHCTLCNSSLKIGSGGRTAAVQHQQRKNIKPL